MILLLAVVAGLLAGLIWAGRQKVMYEAPVLHHLWLVFLAFLPQYIIIYLPIREKTPDWVSAFCLIISQLLLFGFALLNRNHLGMKTLMIGTLLNFMVMAANGGFMPISPQTAGRLVPQEFLLDSSSGSRFGSKDILLLPEQTRFEWLADRFLPPAWLPYQVAFSLGDVFIAAGVFWLLARQKINEQGYNS
jgi:hypothetical protein